MCGIVGCSVKGQSPNLKPGLEAVSHRGPDDSGLCYYLEGSVGLGHVRLSILDLSSAGRQPMLSASGRYSISFNGEIYNFKELKEELEERGFEFKTDTDTEVLLKLLECYGLDSLSRLNGIFAFALLDSFENELHLVRDRFGVKPLYWCENESGIFFASEVKALKALCLDFGQPDSKGLFDYLSFLWRPGNGTTAKRLRKVGPGEIMTIHGGVLSAHWSWASPADPQCRKADIQADQAIESTLSSLDSAVKRQLVSDAPVGAFLSGGLDSSAIVALASKYQPNIECFTIKLVGEGEDGVEDDLPYAQRVAEYFELPLHVVEVGPEDIRHGLRNMVRWLDEPLADPAAINVYFITQLAKSRGMKVLLSGAGGDDLYTGYRRHFAIANQKYAELLPPKFREFLYKVSRNLSTTNPWGRRLAKVFASIKNNGNEAIYSYFSWAEREDVISLFSENFKSELDGVNGFSEFGNYLKQFGEECDYLDRMLSLDQRFFLTDHNLTYTDKMSMSNGIEVRVPFLDNEVFDSASKIPNKYRQRGSQGKWVLKKAMEPILPKEVIYRPKTGFGAPVRNWLNHELRDLVDDNLSYQAVANRGIFDPVAVRQLIEKTRYGTVDGSYTVFSLLCIELWFQEFYDK